MPGVAGDETRFGEEIIVEHQHPFAHDGLDTRLAGPQALDSHNYRYRDPVHTSQIDFDLVAIGPTRASVGG
jgi:hypothetical protein